MSRTPRQLAVLAINAFRNAKCPHHSYDMSLGPPCVIRCTAHDHTLASAINSTRDTDYAFEVSGASLRFGSGATMEVGMDLQNLGAQRTLIVTDPNMVDKPAMKTVLESLKKSNINFEIFEHVKIEPTDASLKEAIFFARRNEFDTFVAVGGGSSIDTAKAAALFNANPFAELLDFVAPPFGRNVPPKKRMLPLIAIPTTAGSGSEATTALAFDYEKEHTKTAIRHRFLRPFLGIVDPLNLATMPKEVATFTGFDILCHALEAYTAIPYYERVPKPTNPVQRPSYQGCNPLSDIWAERALKLLGEHFINSVKHPDDKESKCQMAFAASIAGMGFNSAGVHICHGLAYAIAGNVKAFMSPNYPQEEPLIPHGLSVALTAPQDFELTGPACPERHLRAAELLGADISNAKLDDAGRILADVIRRYMQELNVPNGLAALGFTSHDIEKLAKSAMNSAPMYGICRVPLLHDVILSLFEKSLTSY